MAQERISVGDTVRLTKRIKRRPEYFNKRGAMDYLIGGNVEVKVIGRDEEFLIIDGENCNGWDIKESDCVLVRGEKDD